MVFVALVTSKFLCAKSHDGVYLLLQFKSLTNSELSLAAVRLTRWALCEPGNLVGCALAAICKDSGSLVSLGFLSNLPRDSTRDPSSPLVFRLIFAEILKGKKFLVHQILLPFSGIIQLLGTQWPWKNAAS